MFHSIRCNTLHLLLLKCFRDRIRSERTLYKSFYITSHYITACQTMDAFMIIDLRQLTSVVCYDGTGICEYSRRLIRHRIGCEIELAYVPEKAAAIKSRCFF